MIACLHLPVKLADEAARSDWSRNHPTYQPQRRQFRPSPCVIGLEHHQNEIPVVAPIALVAEHSNAMKVFTSDQLLIHSLRA